MDKNFFNDLKEKVSETAKTAFKKSNELMEITKLSLAIGDLKSKITGAYKDMGKAVYDVHCQGATIGDVLEEKCNEIDGYVEEIASLKEKVAALKNETICPDCQHSNKPEANFCASCGKVLEDKE
ncbi:MAG: zinc ribbon domain-containing protein [Hyphomonadaceae bacterium]|nr:zinc ribbon domain-containing protein [Clostridia bacterium]